MSNFRSYRATQLQRAAISIAANIAGGRVRQYTKEFMQHLFIAYRSLAELETHIQRAQRLNYIKADQIEKLLDKTSIIGKMINGLRKPLEKRGTVICKQESGVKT